ncbi:MAG TPA: restriction endonuclease subunit S [Verrucomicrobiota bacterium]|nr:restriction endonuclease subunit S [Verrucomicrobiota bacterium]HNU51119.1 restriction endonuclease subunit S [Verrucomicrobiota bacterium]
MSKQPTTPPADWEVKRLKDVADIRFSSVDKKSRPGEKPVRLCNYVDAYQNEYVTGREEFMEATATDAEITQFGIQAGDIMVTKDSETPDDIAVPSVYLGESGRLVCGYHLALVRPDQDEVNPVFLAKQIRHHRLARYFGRVCNGLTRYGLPTAAFQEAEIWRPEPPEQDAIARILQDVDQALRETACVIKKLHKVKAGLVLDLLRRGIGPDGELRNPKLHPEQFKRTPVGLVPSCWTVETIGKLCSHVGSGLTPTGGQKVYRKDGVLFIRSQNVAFEGLLLDDVAFIGLETHRAMSRSEILPHDVLLNITGASIGRCCPFPTGLGPANVNQHVCSLRVGPSPREEDAVFLAGFLGSPFGQSQIDRLNAGSNRQGLNYAQIRSLVVPWPDGDERARIADALRAVPIRIESETRLFRKLLRLKVGIAHDLLAGQVRVPAELVSDPAGDSPEGKVVKLGANIHFKRAVLAAEVVDQMHGDITFGHVKFMKTLYLVEQLAELELESHYLRAAAGPFDNRLLRSVDALLSKKQWFDKVPRTGGKQNSQAGEKPPGWSYVPLAKRGEHRPWFEKYWGGAQAKIQAVIDLLKPLDTQRCEILATLYEAWRVLASEGKAVGDGAIVDEVLLRWHESKQAIPRERWLRALEWMRREGMIPKTALSKA